MITIFNRKELICTFDMKRQGEVRRLLSQNHIAYKVKTINRKSSPPYDTGERTRSGNFGEKLELKYEYIIFVNKNDYHEAYRLIKEE